MSPLAPTNHFTQNRSGCTIIPPNEFMGNWDAAGDPLLKPTFVKFFDDEILVHENTTVILAGKGAGKTALVKELIQRFGPDHITISANNIAFKKIIEQWHKARLAGVSEPHHIVDAWKVIFMSIAMFHVCCDADALEASGISGTWLKNMDVYLRRGLGIPDRQRFDRQKLREILANVSTQALKLATFGKIVLDPTPLANALVDAGAEELFRRAALSLHTVLTTASKTMLATLDEFDTFFATQLKGMEWDPAQQEVVHEILFGLLEAVKELGKDGHAQRIRFKILFPRDKFPIHYRDRIKTMQHLQPIFWTPGQLFEFCCRRIGYRFGVMEQERASADPLQTWYALFPNAVSNKGRAKQVKENSFDYVLRHTHYRPRDLQVQVCSILQVWREQYQTTTPLEGVITDSAIRAGVERGNGMLAGALIEEFQEEYPYLESLIAGFRNLPTVLEYDAQVESALRKGAKFVQTAVGRAVSPRRILEILLSVGFLGRFEASDKLTESESSHLGRLVRTVEGNSYRSLFFFSDRHGHAPAVAEGDWLCIHPIFHEKLQCRPSELYLVGGGRLTM